MQDELRRRGRRQAGGYATFGLVVLLALAARYVDVPGSRAFLTVRVIAAGALAGAVLACGALSWHDRRQRTRQSRT